MTSKETRKTIGNDSEKSVDLMWKTMFSYRNIDPYQVIWVKSRSAM